MSETERKFPLKKSIFIICFSVKTMFCNFRVSPEGLILNWNFFDAPDFERKLYNVTDFEFNILERLRNWKKFSLINSLSEPCYSVEVTFSAISLLFRNACFWVIIFSLPQTRNLKVHINRNFWSKPIQRIKFWTKVFTTCQILTWNLWKVSEFERTLHSQNHLFKNVTP